jgi:hypothetical protein
LNYAVLFATGRQPSRLCVAKRSQIEANGGLMANVEEGRVFVGGIDKETTTIEEIRERFFIHGSIRAVNIYKGFAFVQFDTSEAAQAAIAKENNAVFKDRIIRVKKAMKVAPDGASSFSGQKNKHAASNYGPAWKKARTEDYGHDRGRQMSRETAPSRPQSSSDSNDVEIVCISRADGDYAEHIEQRFKKLGMQADILYPNADAPIDKILDIIGSRGGIYAVVVTPQNAGYQSATVNILQGQKQEHRNMPLDAAIAFVHKDFMSNRKTEYSSSNERHPSEVMKLLGFLAEDRPLTVTEFDRLIKYMVQKREQILHDEYGANVPAHLANPPLGKHVDPAVAAKQDDLQSRILVMLNRRKEQAAAIAPSLQRAIDNLLNTGPNVMTQLSRLTAMPPQTPANLYSFPDFSSY